MSTKINIKNKKARFEYELLDFFTAGIQLLGTEIKSIRNSKASITEAYCIIIKNEFWIKNMHIQEYSHGNYNNHEPRRLRKLLLNRQELEKIIKKLKNKGITVVPVKLFLNAKGFAKLEIALAQGKKLHDKRESIKKREDKIRIDRALKN